MLSVLDTTNKCGSIKIRELEKLERGQNSHLNQTIVWMFIYETYKTIVHNFECDSTVQVSYDCEDN